MFSYSVFLIFLVYFSFARLRLKAGAMLLTKLQQDPPLQKWVQVSPKAVETSREVQPKQIHN